MKKLIVNVQDHVPICPYCRAKNNAMHGPKGMPEDGDVSFCAHCLKASIFSTTQAGELTIRAPINEEEAMRAMEAVRELLEEL